MPRCWVYETSIALGEELANGNELSLPGFNTVLELPENDYLEYFGPEYKLHMPVSNMENQNSRRYMDFVL